MKTYNISNLLGQSDILEIDLEKIEFDMNFNTDNKLTMFDGTPEYGSLINFSEPDGEMYGDEEAWNPDMGADDDEDEVFEDRDSYRNADLDDVYYFI